MCASQMPLPCHQKSTVWADKHTCQMGKKPQPHPSPSLFGSVWETGLFLQQHLPGMVVLSPSPRLFFYVHLCFACVHVCVRVPDPLELESQRAVSCLLVLGTEAGYFARTACAFNLQAISPALGMGVLSKGSQSCGPGSPLFSPTSFQQISLCFAQEHKLPQGWL